jgi:hypothetical protein
MDIKGIHVDQYFDILCNNEWGNIKIGSQILEIINFFLKAKHTRLIFPKIHEEVMYPHLTKYILAKFFVKTHT